MAPKIARIGFPPSAAKTSLWAPHSFHFLGNLGKFLHLVRDRYRTGRQKVLFFTYEIWSAVIHHRFFFGRSVVSKKLSARRKRFAEH
jgi:hypothetical protein